MPPIKIEISLELNKKFEAALEKASKISEDLTIPLTLIANDFYTSQAAIWKLKGPGQYEDLNSKYKKAKQKQVGFVYPILTRRGYLETAASRQGAPGNITLIGKKTLVMGVDPATIPYSPFLQLGTSKMPARPYVFIGPEAPKFALSETKGRLERWLGILSSYCTEALRAPGVEIKKP